MKSWTNKYDCVRKKTSLLIACLILFVGIFATVVYNMSADLADEIEIMEHHQEKALQEYLQLALDIDQSSLNTMESLFSSMVKEYGDHYPKEYVVERFTNEVFDSVIETMALSIIIAYDENGDLIQVTYKESVYDEKLHFLDDISLGKPLIVLNETDKDLPFGKGERIYLSGRKLTQLRGVTLYVYTGFEEKLRIDNFISTLETESFYRAKDKIRIIAVGAMHFTYFLGFLSIVMIAFIRKFNLDMLIAYTETIIGDEPILNRNALGEIAVRNGYLTVKQVEKCLEQQAEEIYKKHVTDKNK